MTGAKLMTAPKAKTIADMRAKTPEQILAVSSPDRFESGLPVTDGYVLTASMRDVFGQGRQNDVPLLAGSNSDEGSNFPSFRTFAAFREDAHKSLGPFADEFFTLYPAADDAQARRASEHAVRDTRPGTFERLEACRPSRAAHGRSGRAIIIAGQVHGEFPRCRPRRAAAARLVERSYMQL